MTTKHLNHKITMREAWAAARFAWCGMAKRHPIRAFLLAVNYAVFLYRIYGHHYQMHQAGVKFPGKSRWSVSGKRMSGWKFQAMSREWDRCANDGRRIEKRYLRLERFIARSLTPRL